MRTQQSRSRESLNKDRAPSATEFASKTSLANRRGLANTKALVSQTCLPRHTELATTTRLPTTTRLLWLAIIAIPLLTGVATYWLTTPAFRAAPGSPHRHAVSALLHRVRIVPHRVKVPGYERACDSKHACSFGRAWSDETSAPESHNGCDTRTDVLRHYIEPNDTSVPIRHADRSQCAIFGGKIIDPYTGTTLTVNKQSLRKIDIDHIIPLAAAWDLGAAQWPMWRKSYFANDVETNLVPTLGTVNRAKSDSTPESWMPPDVSRHCWYAALYLRAAVRHDIALTENDHKVLVHAAESCPL